MSDMELIKLAAQAAGLSYDSPNQSHREEEYPHVISLFVYRGGRLVSTGWSPLESDSDAFGLAVDLGLKLPKLSRRSEARRAITEAAASLTTAKRNQHEWESPDLSTCVKCGDKDWMADAECSESKVKRPRLFYYEEAINAWTPAPDRIEHIISVEDQLGDCDKQEIEFKRFDMTDAEFEAIPVE